MVLFVLQHECWITMGIFHSLPNHFVFRHCHVMTWYKVKVARHKEQQTYMLSLFHLSQHRSATQENGIVTLNTPQATKSTQALRQTALCHFAFRHVKVPH